MIFKNITSKPWRWIGIAGGLLVVVFLGWYFLSGADSVASEAETYNPAFNKYISSHTAGVISVASPVRVQFTSDVVDSMQTGQEVGSRIFSISPKVNGKVYWVDNQTMEFIPSNRLASGTTYKISIALGRLMEVPADLSAFTFSVLTMRQNYSLDVERLSPYNNNELSRQKLSGIILTADVANDVELEKVLLATQEGNQLAVNWTHAPDQKTHRFEVENIQRGETASLVKLNTQGNPINVDKTDLMEVEIPALGDFKLVRTEVVQSPEQYLELQFSDPLEASQNLNGLISIEGTNANFRFIIENNSIMVYPATRLAGIQTVAIAEGMKNSLGYKLKERTTVDITFEQPKPAVRFVGKGVIIPGTAVSETDGLVMPFEAVNLKSVDVTVLRIYENNLAQFFQVNQYDGNAELRRVGRPVVQKTISLEAAGVADLGRWNRFTLDLSELMKTEPGAIYQVKIGFRPQHSVYHCEGAATFATEEEIVPELGDWDMPGYYYDDYDYYYPEGYRWEDRDNPCTVSYYTPDKTIRKNIFSSDLGIIAKQGNDGNILVAITDMKTAQPLSGVDVRLLDFQQKVLANGTTDAEGKVAITTERKPFLLLASHENQKGYLRIDDGSSLSLSNFDVSGVAVQNGIKGFLYGDRGVWRPGDSLHLNFMLEDKNQMLPAHHPVVFTLKDPQGNVTQRLVRNAPVGEIYNFSTKTESSAPTGNWLATAQVGGATFNKSIKIETIKPNRLRINLDFGRAKFTAESPNISGNLNVQWLSGATARNLRAEFELLLSEGKTTFENYENYVFDDIAREFSSESEIIFDGQLNEHGEATVTTTLPTENDIPGVLNATFIGKVFEEGGNFSIDQFTLPYYPYTSFVGVNVPEGEGWNDALYTDEKHQIDVVVVDADGNPASRSQINMELYKLDWRWWWDRSQESIANYIGNSYQKPIQKGIISATNGKGQWNFTINRPEWGRFYIRACDPVSGHCAGDVVYIDWPGYAGRGDRESPGGAAMLSFSSDKDTYQVGEEATIHIPGSNQGKALVSVENGSRVIQTHWVTTLAGETPFSFSITEAMAPNVYVHVSLLQPHAQTVNDLPIRMYGLVPIGVDDPATHLNPEIEMPDELSPEQKVSIRITEENGKPMTYTVAVVDEGLLDITRFQTPAPWDHFYARDALGVKTWDLYDYVVGAFGGELERILAIGGDDALLNRGERKANRFQPVVQFMGPFFLEKGKTNQHSFTMPRYVGSVRTMVVAGYEGAYGHAEKATPVRKPLMVLGTLPRVLGPEEEVQLPVNVFAMDNSVKNVNVSVSTNNLIAVQGENQKSTSFSETGDKAVGFDLKVQPQVGIGQVNITAISGSQEARYDVEIDVRNPNPPVVEVLNTVIQPGNRWSITYNPIGIAGTNTTTLEVSGIPPINLEKRLGFLMNYPHGCIEQTVSAAFPQLYVQNLTELSEDEKQRTEAHIKAAISRIRRFVTSEGGFAYWPGSDDTDEWGTTYAGHFLLEAQQQGYIVPVGLLNSWKQYQARRAAQWNSRSDYHRSDLNQAYRLYTLALAESADVGAMNRMREQSNLSLQAKWRLAAAYVIIGQPEAARQMIANLSTSVPDYRELSYTYGSSLRDEAMILETLSLLNDKTQGLDLMRKISAALSEDDRWMSTQTTAYCLIAAIKFIGDDLQSDQVNFSFAMNNQSSTNVQSRLPVVQRDLAEDDGNLQVNNRGEGVLYARLVQKGTPVQGDQSAAENGLRMSVIYKGINEEVLDPTSLVQGTDFVAEVTIYNPGTRGSYQELALTQIFPSGWEILNIRLYDLDQFYAEDKPRYQDIRDDRVYTYFDLDAGERKTFKVLLNASYAGRFYLPTLYCEAMYDNTLNARKPGQWVEVVRQ